MIPSADTTDETILLNYLARKAYYSSRHRLLYLSTAKVACTSLKWWFARLVGKDAEIRQQTDSCESEPELRIHGVFREVAPEVTALGEAALSKIFSSPSIFKFAVVRNPYKRIFSAWQSKIFLKDPIHSRSYRDFSFYNRSIRCHEDVAISLETFLEHVYTLEYPCISNPHWAEQSRLLRPDFVPYSCVSKIEDVTSLKKQLEAHLGPAFEDPFSPRRSNASLIPYSAAYITPRSRELILKMYACDFETFDYPLEVPCGGAQMGDETLATALRAVQMLQDRHKVIEDLCSRISRMKHRGARKKGLRYFMGRGRSLKGLLGLLIRSISRRR